MKRNQTATSMILQNSNMFELQFIQFSAHHFKKTSLNFNLIIDFVFL